MDPLSDGGGGFQNPDHPEANQGTTTTEVLQTTAYMSYLNISVKKINGASEGRCLIIGSFTKLYFKKILIIGWENI